ncbi:MAG: hypothetical protein ACRD3I_01770 [Terriglobales bacterium]
MKISIVRVLAVIIALTLTLSASAAGGKTTIKLFSNASLNGKTLAAGEYKVTWERHSVEADVTFSQGKQAITTVRGKFVEREKPSPYTAVVTKPNGDGTRTITELRFEGKKEVLVLSD